MDRFLPGIQRRASITLALLLLLLCLLPWAAGFLGQDYLVKLVTRMLIWGLAAMALDLALGVGGLVSFGHAAFLGIGGYVAGIAFQHDFQGVPFLGIAASQEFVWLALIAMAVSAVFAAITGLVSLRCRGVAFIMITLAFAQMLYFLFVSLRYYNGQDGIALWQRSTLLGTDLLEDARVFYFLVLGILVVSILLVWRLVSSPFGAMLQAASNNATRFRSLGSNPDRYRLAAYILSGALAGLAGLLLANASYFVGPSYLSWQNSGHLIIMVVMGGIGTIVGPVLGAILFVCFEEWMPFVIELFVEGGGQHWRIVFGPILILIALYARGGLAGLLLGNLRRHE